MPRSAFAWEIARTSISSKVGPAGSFSLAYELGRVAPGSMEELIERKSLRFDLRSWEIVPESDNRGETYESIKNPISEFSRADQSDRSRTCHCHSLGLSRQFHAVPPSA